MKNKFDTMVENLVSGRKSCLAHATSDDCTVIHEIKYPLYTKESICKMLVRNSHR